MSFLTFILLLLLVIVGWPLLRGWLFVRDVRKRVNDTFGGDDQYREGQRYDDDQEEYTETGERKIFTSGEGEYAEFEEVSGTIVEETSTDGDTRTIIEEQVTDAEFEEIP
jgi:hypothetical protein